MLPPDPSSTRLQLDEEYALSKARAECCCALSWRARDGYFSRATSATVHKHLDMLQEASAVS
jgi:hypothetical protein